MKFVNLEERRQYNRRHYLINKKYGKASQYDCLCGRFAQVWSQLHNTEGDSPDDYIPMCYWCHNSYDAFTMYGKDRNRKVSEASQRMWEQAPEEKLKVMSGNATGKRSLEARANIGAGKIGNSYATGKRTPEQCERIRIARWGR